MRKGHITLIMCGVCEVISNLVLHEIPQILEAVHSTPELVCDNLHPEIGFDSMHLYIFMMRVAVHVH